jgi:hypothetical protein
VDIEVVRVVGRQPWMVVVAGHPSHSRHGAHQGEGSPGMVYVGHDWARGRAI